MDFELSTYQKKILDEFKNSNDNLFISARAGASKTFMLVEISKLINTYSVFLAFNKVIQMELADKIRNPKFRTYTLNGLGYQILLKNAEEQGLPKVTIDQYKTSNICRKIASSDIPEYKTYNWELKKECIDNLTTLYELCRACLYDMGDYNQLKEIIDKYDLFQEEVKEPLELVKIMNRIDTLNMYQFENDGIISFSDQLYITVKKLQTKEWAVPGYLKFFNILVDECMPGNIRIKTNEGQITLQKLYKLYENKEKLPMAKSYNEENDIFEYKQILNVKKHKNRKVYEISTEGLNKMQATENHKFLTQRGYVAVSDLVVGKDILMLDSSINQKSKIGLNEDQLQIVLASGIGDGHLEKMSKFNTYRISFTQGEAQYNYLKFKADMLNCSFIRESKSGYCDNRIFQTSTRIFYLKDDYWELIKQLDERFLAIWFQDDGSSFYNKDNTVNSLAIACNNLNENQIELLIEIIKEKFNLQFLKTFSKNKYWGLRLRAKEANEFLKLIAPYMNKDLYYKNPYVDKDNLYKWNNKFLSCGGNFVKSIKYIGEQDVFDIEVQDNHNFVCTKSYGEKIVGIISHNCQDLNAVQQQLIYYIRRKDSRIIAVGDKFQSIYGFNGSDKYAIDNFKRIYKMKELELPICYRCPKSHLRYVNKEFPNIGIQSAPFAKEGAIKIIDEEEIMNYVQTGDFILSRKNKNLCCIVLSLLEKGIPIYFKDAQFVEKIIKKVEKIEKKVNNIYELEEYIVREQQSSKDKLKNAVELFLDKGEEQAHQDMEKYNYSNEIVDLFDCILILLKNYLNKNKDKICTIQKFINYIREMLNTTERKNAVVCSSIHQAKGSETNNVFVLDEAKPAIYNFMTSDQIQQEKNLSYVALTRAKENLYLVVMPDEDEENEYNYSKFINKSNQTIDEFDADEDAGEYFDVELEDLLP